MLKAEVLKRLKVGAFVAHAQGTERAQHGVVIAQTGHNEFGKTYAVIFDDDSRCEVNVRYFLGGCTSFHSLIDRNDLPTEKVDLFEKLSTRVKEIAAYFIGPYEFNPTYRKRRE